MHYGISGSQRITNQTDVAVGTSGKPTRVFSLSVTSGGSAGITLLRNGTSASGTALYHMDGTISKCVTQNFEGGMLFPAGCFADVDANCASVTVCYASEL